MQKNSKRQAEDARQNFPAQGTQTEIVGGLKLKAAAVYLGGLSVPTMHRLVARGLLKPNRWASPPLVPNRGTQPIPSTVKANLLFTPGIREGDGVARKDSFFLEGSNETPSPPQIGRWLYDKEVRNFSATKTSRPLAAPYIRTHANLRPIIRIQGCNRGLM